MPLTLSKDILVVQVLLIPEAIHLKDFSCKCHCFVSSDSKSLSAQISTNDGLGIWNADEP